MRVMRNPWMLAWTLAAVVFGPIPVRAEPAPGLEPLRFLLGDWQAAGGGKPGEELGPDGVLAGRFEVAPPDKPESFGPYLAWTSRRAVP